MALRGITLNLNAAQFSDLFFNFEHPARTALYKKAGDGSAGDDSEEMDAADLEDAKEFAAVVGIEDDAIIAALVIDFQKRI